MNRRLKILLSAYACEPGKGSEPGVGWNMALNLAKHHEVWVVTRVNNRRAIEAEVKDKELFNLHFIYYDLPQWARFWKRGSKGVRLYYYLWQVGIFHLARRIVRQIDFDLVHHVTFVKYWSPSLLCLLPVPFVWGPVGGADCTPAPFKRDFGLWGRLYENLRETAIWLGEKDPLVKMTARKSSIAFATTGKTAERLKKFGAKNVIVYPESGLSTREIEAMSACKKSGNDTIRFISIGRLLHFKGFQLGLKAFAAAQIEGEYWVVGDGPERSELEKLADELGLQDRVKFWGNLPRSEALKKLAECDVLVHPSLHESGGWVCLEGMASGKPVICFDLGGPAVQVTEKTGFKILAKNREQAVRDIAGAMKKLTLDHGLSKRLGENGICRVNKMFNWKEKCLFINSVYNALLTSGAETGGS